MRRFLIEEAYEAADAIDNADDIGLREELGDILLHVCFHAIIAEERGVFDIEDVISAVSDKLVRRHPHVFNGLEVSGPGEVLTNWETIKSRESADGRYVLNGIPRTLPALLRAHRIQERVRTVGFEWDDVSGVLKKIEEELDEVRSAIDAYAERRLEYELGDLLFSVVNLCRYLGVDSSVALNRTNDEFVRRFNAVEDELMARGKSVLSTDLEELEKIWESVK